MGLAWGWGAALLLAQASAGTMAPPEPEGEAEHGKAPERELEPVMDLMVPESEAAPPTPPLPLIMPRDTPVRLMVLNEVSTKEHGAGHRFRLRVDEAVIIDGETIIPVGTMAWGEVLDAESSGGLGKRGRLSAKLLYIDLAGREIPIEGEASHTGKSGTSETVLGALALGPLALFARGNNAKLKAGERMTAFTIEDESFDVE